VKLQLPIAITFDDGYRSVYENAWFAAQSRNGGERIPGSQSSAD
jgi:hypothetical protein